MNLDTMIVDFEVMSRDFVGGALAVPTPYSKSDCDEQGLDVSVLCQPSWNISSVFRKRSLCFSIL